MGLRASNYMTKDVVTVGRAANMAEIVALLKKHRIPGVPVVDEEGHLLGLVTHEELVNIFIPHYLSMFDELAFLDDRHIQWGTRRGGRDLAPDLRQPLLALFKVGHGG